jgi:hypothetical protein
VVWHAFWRDFGDVASGALAEVRLVGIAGEFVYLARENEFDFVPEGPLESEAQTANTREQIDGPISIHVLPQLDFSDLSINQLCGEREVTESNRLFFNPRY